MASGKFSSMNKIRPGAYINFETNAERIADIGKLGIATMVYPLSWGVEGELIEVTAEELQNGKSLAKIGLVSTDADAKLLNLALQNCRMLKLYNTNSGGVKASKTLTDGLTITARHAGTFGNKIAIVIKALTNVFSVETYADGYFIESQKVNAINQLVDNDFVKFSGSGSLAETASTLLTGGTNGTAVASSTYLPLYFNKLRATKWNTLALNSSTSADKEAVAAFIQTMREDEGKYVQAVVADYNTADYEGIINNTNGVVLEDGTTITKEQFTVWIAGATAGADIVESLTGKIVDGAVSITDELTSTQIEQGLQAGKFILSANQSGAIKVEKDINSLHTFTADKNYMFSKNRVIRELDEIGTSIEDIWETTYLGKVSNNENGRTLFKSSIIDYLTSLVNKGAIEEFDAEQVIVEAGDDIDSVIASIAIKPIDSMEFLYMTVNVEQ